MKKVVHNITIFEDNKNFMSYPENEREIYELIKGDLIGEIEEESYQAIQKGDYEI